MLIKIPKFWSICFRNLAKNTTNFPAAFGGQRFALERNTTKKYIWSVSFGNSCNFRKYVYNYAHIRAIPLKKAPPYKKAPPPC